MMTTNLEDEFYRQFRGAFSGILRWPQLASFWQTLKTRADAGWYIYALGEAVPQQPASAEQLHRFIDELDVLLKKEHQEDYCGIVYVDDEAEPTFVKIYDPGNLGVVCGFSDQPPLPGWTLSLMPPQMLNEKMFLTQSRKRWWRRLFA